MAAAASAHKSKILKAFGHPYDVKLLSMQLNLYDCVAENWIYKQITIYIEVIM